MDIALDLHSKTLYMALGLGTSIWFSCDGKAPVILLSCSPLGIVSRAAARFEVPSLEQSCNTVGHWCCRSTGPAGG